jgi:hypothetical protein
MRTEARRIEDQGQVIEAGSEEGSEECDKKKTEQNYDERSWISLRDAALMTCAHRIITLEGNSFDNSIRDLFDRDLAIRRR